MSTTVRIDEETHAVLRELAANTREPMQMVLAKAIETYRRQLILEEANRGYAALREDAAAWNEELEERREWEATLADGLHDK